MFGAGGTGGRKKKRKKWFGSMSARRHLEEKWGSGENAKGRSTRSAGDRGKGWEKLRIGKDY